MCCIVGSIIAEFVLIPGTGMFDPTVSKVVLRIKEAIEKRALNFTSPGRSSVLVADKFKFSSVDSGTGKSQSLFIVHL